MLSTLLNLCILERSLDVSLDVTIVIQSNKDHAAAVRQQSFGLKEQQGVWLRVMSYPIKPSVLQERADTTCFVLAKEDQ
jgi:hypothetical protein